VGWIDSTTAVRRNSPWVFVKDLLLDNPSVSDRLNLIIDQIPSPLHITDIPTLLDVMR